MYRDGKSGFVSKVNAFAACIGMFPEILNDGDSTYHSLKGEEVCSPNVSVFASSSYSLFVPSEDCLKRNLKVVKSLTCHI